MEELFFLLILEPLLWSFITFPTFVGFLTLKIITLTRFPRKSFTETRENLCWITYGVGLFTLIGLSVLCFSF